MQRPRQDSYSALSLRIASDDDAAKIARVAALDSARPPEAPVLIAEVDGEISVAVSLVDLRSVADPFRLTEHVRAIAVNRAGQLQGQKGQLQGQKGQARSRGSGMLLRARRWAMPTG